MPPSTWQVLWCSAVPATPSAQPASEAPYSSRPRASRSSGAATIPSSPSRSARVPSSASSIVTGVAPGDHSASTQCASAFIALGPLTASGRSRLSSGS